jgi:hypothetical protein
MRHLFGPFAKAAFGKVYTDLAAMEDILRRGDLERMSRQPSVLSSRPTVDGVPVCAV